MDTDTRKRFWDEMIIPTQEETTDVAFANPADVARSLIKARNWMATLTQELTFLNTNALELRNTLNNFRTRLKAKETTILARAISEVSSGYFKNRDLQLASIWRTATDREKEEIHEFETQIDHFTQELNRYEGEYQNMDVMRKALEKSTDWLVQYINWHKFELRELT
jgi:molecular chaperone GrpE (heat shock protein)